MGSKFGIYKGGRWIKLNLDTGRLDGERKKPRFFFVKRGTLQLSEAACVLKCLREFTPGQLPKRDQSTSYVQLGVSLAMRRKRYRRRRRRCCPCAHRSCHTAPCINIQQPVTVTQTTQSTIQHNVPSQLELPLQLPPKTKPPITKEQHDDSSETPYKELFIDYTDVKHIKEFLIKNPNYLGHFDEEEFENNEMYRNIILFKLNPLVKVAKSKKIDDWTEQKEMSLREFAATLGLTHIQEKIEDRHSYKTRQKIEQRLAKKRKLLNLHNHKENSNQNKKKFKKETGMRLRQNLDAVHSKADNDFSKPTVRPALSKNCIEIESSSDEDKENRRKLRRNPQRNLTPVLSNTKHTPKRLSRTNVVSYKDTENESTSKDDSENEKKSDKQRKRNVFPKTINSKNDVLDKSTSDEEMENEKKLRRQSQRNKTPQIPRSSRTNILLHDKTENKVTSDEDKENGTIPNLKPSRRKYNIPKKFSKLLNNNQIKGNIPSRSSQKTNEDRDKQSLHLKSKPVDLVQSLNLRNMNQPQIRLNKKNTEDDTPTRVLRKTMTPSQRNSKFVHSNDGYPLQNKSKNNMKSKTIAIEEIPTRTLRKVNTPSNLGEENDNFVNPKVKLAASEKDKRKNKTNSSETSSGENFQFKRFLTKRMRVGLHAKKPIPTQRKSSDKVREYSSLEDHTIVSWVSAGRERLVNGNQVWRELQRAYPHLAGRERSWHSLRNRYLRYILPGLPALCFEPELQRRLRAAAATGALKLSRKRSRQNSLLVSTPVKSASGANCAPRVVPSPSPRALDLSPEAGPSASPKRTRRLFNPRAELSSAAPLSDSD